MCPEAYQRFRAQEREGYNAAAGQGKSTWGRVLEGIKTTFTPQPTPLPTPPTPTGTPMPPITSTPAAIAAPKPPTSMPAPIPTITPTPTAAPQATGKPWWLSSSLEEAAKALVQTIPSAKVGSWRNPIPLFSQVSPGHVISFGKVSSGMLASDANPNLTLNPDGSITPSVGKQPIASLTPRADGFDFNLRNPWQRYEFAEGTVKATLSSSVTARVTWDGFWNTTVGLDVNYPEVQVNGMGVKGRLSDGWYLEYKPGRVVTYTVGAQVFVGAIVAGILLVPSIPVALTPVVQPVYEMIKQFLAQFRPGIP